MVFVFFATVFGLLCTSVHGEQATQICKPTQHQDARDNILAFFKVRDALNITWLHAVNSPIRLQQGLSGEIMMLEADVLMRNNKVNGTPVMAHPPDVDSNLTLADFLNQTTASTKGIKLDFKTIVVVEPSLKMIKNVTSGKEVKIPIWLNADILSGPCYDKVCVPVDHVKFLSLCRTYFPKATLSISWTTGSDMMAAENYYNWSQVLPMGKLVSEISQPITFPIRAVLVKRSWKQIHWLLDLSDTFTVTIWSSAKDKLDVQDLVELRRSVSDKRKIYYDLPTNQEKEFKEALKSAGNNYNKDSSIDFAWRVTANKRCEDVLVGQNSVMFSGGGGTVVSEKPLFAVYALYSLFVEGIISFIKTEGLPLKRTVTIQLHVANTTGTPTDAKGKAISSNQGVITMDLHSNGAFQLSVNGVEPKVGSVKSETGGFKFSIVENSSDGKHRTVKCEITAQDSKGDKTTVSLATKSEPVAGHVLINTKEQAEAILVQNVEVLLAAAQVSGGASTGYYYYHKFIIVLGMCMWVLLQSLSQV